MERPANPHEQEVLAEAVRFAHKHDLLDDDHCITLKELKRAKKSFCMNAKESEAVEYMLDNFKVIANASNDQYGKDSEIKPQDLIEHASRRAQGKGPRDTTWDILYEMKRTLLR